MTTLDQKTPKGKSRGGRIRKYFFNLMERIAKAQEKMPICKG